MNTLLERAQQQGAPILEGDQATFVWRGPRPPRLMGDFTNWESGTPISLVEAAPDVWVHTATLPRDTYMEYAFLAGEERALDPSNRRITPNGMGKFNNYFYMPDGQRTPLSRYKRGVPRGTVTRHDISTDGLAASPKRRVYLYRPVTSEPCPLLVVLDGEDYHLRARLATIVDNLIAQRRVRPIAMAMVSHSAVARSVEYSCSEATLGFLARGVLRLARTQLNLLDIDTNPGAFGILGASLGGLTALFAGLRMPQLFGRVLSQSGAFSWLSGDRVVYDLVEYSPVQPLHIWMDVGRYEWLLETNRHMGALLESRGYEVTYHEYNAGHNYPAWRDDVWRGLEALYGPEARQ